LLRELEHAGVTVAGASAFVRGLLDLPT
jgi:hypothetical protein